MEAIWFYVLLSIEADRTLLYFFSLRYTKACTVLLEHIAKLP